MPAPVEPDEIEVDVRTIQQIVELPDVTIPGESEDQETSVSIEEAEQVVIDHQTDVILVVAPVDSVGITSPPSEVEAVLQDQYEILTVGSQGPTGSTGATGSAGPTGLTGPQGPPGSGVVELYDSMSVPVSPAFPYLRFERDMAGDVQVIYLGTTT